MASPTNSAIPDPFAPLSASEEEQAAARRAQLRATAQSVFFFGSVSAASVALRSRAPAASGAVLKFASGFEFTQAAAALRGGGVGVSRAVRPTPFVVLLGAPSPIGVVPPEKYGLRPDYLDVRLVPEALRFETLGTKADPERLNAFLAQNARAAFEAELVALGRLPLEELRAQIDALAALPPEARVIGSPAQTYYATAVETLARRERLARTFGGSAPPSSVPVALFVSQSQAEQLRAGQVLAVPVAPLTRPQVPGAPPVPLVNALPVLPSNGPAAPVVSLLDGAGNNLPEALPALFPSLQQPTTSAARATAEQLREGQREHITERADP